MKNGVITLIVGNVMIVPEPLHRSTTEEILLVRVWLASAEQMAKPDPFGKIEEETGQPWREFDAMCVLVVRDRRCEVKGIQSVPKRAHVAFRILAKHCSWIELWGERWQDGVKRVKRYSLSARWENAAKDSK